MIAGKMTKTNKIGYIASFPIPEVDPGHQQRPIIHAKKVNPDVEFSVVWAYTWFDPAKEADAAKALIEQGADVILQHTDSTAPQAAAAEAGNVITFGQASDMAEYAPMPRVSSIIDNWAPYYIERVQAVMDGTWDKRQHLGRDRAGHGRDRRDLRRGSGRCEGRGRGAARFDRLGRVPSVHRPAEQAGRLGLAGRGRSGR